MIKEFDASTAQRGQEITEEVYKYFFNAMPPIHLRGGQGVTAGFQMNEPYCHMEDTRTGAYRPMYMTFTKADGRYYYQGINFTGEVDSRDHIARF